jgi:hypothetical protein
MPFKSQAQRRFMFAQHPKMAKEFAAATPKGKKLPEKLHPEESVLRTYLKKKRN